MNIKSPDQAKEEGPVDPFLTKLKELETAYVSVTPYEKAIHAYLVRFMFGIGTTTVKINIEGENKENVVITNITTLPDTEKGKGYAPEAIKLIIDWAKKNGFENIIATQVQEHNENFWKKNGFQLAPNGEQMGDFIYKS
jgi:hypothetical protein